MLITNDICLLLDTKYFTYDKTSGKNVIDFMLVFEGILNHIHKVSLVPWTLESNFRTLYIDQMYKMAILWEGN